MIIYDDCPEVYAILLQNKCDEKLIKQTAIQCVRRGFSEQALLFCKRIDPGNLILKAHAKQLLGRWQPTGPFSGAIQDIALETQDDIYKEIIQVYVKFA